MRLLIGTLGLAAVAALWPYETRTPFLMRPELTERGTCIRAQDWSVRIRPRDTVRTGAELRLECTIGGGTAGGTFRVTLRAPDGTLSLAQTSWDETLAPGQYVVRTVGATCLTDAPVPLVAQVRRLDAGFENTIPAQHALRLLPLPAGVSAPAGLGWDAGSGRALGTPGEEHLQLKSGETILVVPAH